MMEITSYTGDMRFLAADLVVAGLYEDERPSQGLAGLVDWFLFGQLTDLILGGKVTGRAGEFALLATQGRIAVSRFMIAGLGARARMTPSVLEKLLPGITDNIRSLRPAAVAVEILGATSPALPADKAARLLLSSLTENGRPEPAGRLLLVPGDETEQEIINKLL
jgi:hypothetical protein